MRRLLFIISFFHLVIPSFAQQGLNMNELFAGRIIPQERVIETRIRGKVLSKYQLTYFRSLRFKASDKEVADLRRLMKEDGKGHFVMGSDRAETKGSQAVQNYIYRIQLSPQGGKNRFLCYQDVYTKKSMRDVLVIYMEGNVSGLDKLDAIIKSKNN